MSRNRKYISLVFFIFLLPVVIGSLLYVYRAELNISQNTINYGVLVQPAKLVDSQHLQTDNKTFFSKKWTLLYLAPNGCDTICEQQLKNMQTTRLLTNDKMRRIQIHLVTSQTEVAKLKQTYWPLDVANTKQSEFYQQFPNIDAHQIYMIDPLGYLMMVYPQSDLDIKKVLKDFKRLLKYSHIG